MAKKQTKTGSSELPAATLNAVRKRAEELAQANDLVVHDVTFGPTDFGLTLSVIIKSPENAPRAISVTDCEVVSRPISKELDDLMANFGPNYLFEVTSIGIDEGDV